MAHGDDQGLVLPPKVAPIQVVIIPIPKERSSKKMSQTHTAASLCDKGAKEVKERLQKEGIRVKVDEREEYTPGFKFNYWELRGVPIRLEIGPKDAETKEVTIVRRDTLERTKCGIDEVTKALSEIGKQLTVDIRERAWEWMKQHIHLVHSLEEATDIIESRAGVAQAPWCGNEKCGREIEEKTDARVLGIPLDMEMNTDEQCVICGEKSRQLVRIATAY